jgi:DNA-binding NarL/FixJ family response regulator
MSSAIAREVIRVFQKPAPSAAVPEPTAGGGGSRLNSRETELLGHLAQGLAYKEAAEVMGVSLETVRTFVRRIYEKLQVHTRHAAVAWFHEANGRKPSSQ